MSRRYWSRVPDDKHRCSGQNADVGFDNLRSSEGNRNRNVGSFRNALDLCRASTRSVKLGIEA